MYRSVQYFTKVTFCFNTGFHGFHREVARLPTAAVLLTMQAGSTYTRASNTYQCI